jgi:hypothetical protein
MRETTLYQRAYGLVGDAGRGDGSLHLEENYQEIMIGFLRGMGEMSFRKAVKDAWQEARTPRQRCTRCRHAHTVQLSIDRGNGDWWIIYLCSNCAHKARYEIEKFIHNSTSPEYSCIDVP